MAPISGEVLLLPVSNYTMIPYFEDSNCLARCIFGLFKCCPCLLKYLLSHLQRRGMVIILFNMTRYKEFDTVSSYGGNGILTDSPIKASKYFRGSLDFEEEIKLKAKKE